MNTLLQFINARQEADIRDMVGDIGQYKVYAPEHGYEVVVNYGPAPIFFVIRGENQEHIKQINEHIKEICGHLVNEMTLKTDVFCDLFEALMRQGDIMARWFNSRENANDKNIFVRDMTIIAKRNEDRSISFNIEFLYFFDPKDFVFTENQRHYSTYLIIEHNGRVCWSTNEL